MSNIQFLALVATEAGLVSTGQASVRFTGTLVTVVSRLDSFSNSHFHVLVVTEADFLGAFKSSIGSACTCVTAVTSGLGHSYGDLLALVVAELETFLLCARDLSVVFTSTFVAVVASRELLSYIVFLSSIVANIWQPGASTGYQQENKKLSFHCKMLDTVI